MEVKFSNTQREEAKQSGKALFMFAFECNRGTLMGGCPIDKDLGASLAAFCVKVAAGEDPAKVFRSCFKK